MIDKSFCRSLWGFFDRQRLKVINKFRENRCFLRCEIVRFYEIKKRLDHLGKIGQPDRGQVQVNGEFFPAVFSALSVFPTQPFRLHPHVIVRNFSGMTGVLEYLQLLSGPDQVQ